MKKREKALTNTAHPQNSMAAGLSTAMTVIIWLSVIIGVFAFVALATALNSGIQGEEVSLFGLVTVETNDVTPGMIISALASLVVLLPGIVFICVQLRRILSTLATGDPFVPDNTSRLTKIAAAIALMEIARMVAVILIGNFVDFGPDAAGPQISISLVSWAAAVAFFVLSQVFREGTRLREDAKMTI